MVLQVVGGLAVVTVGLVILSVLLKGTYEAGARVAIVALLVLGIIAGAATFYAIGAAHAALSEVTTLPIAFALGVIALTNTTSWPTRRRTRRASACSSRPRAYCWSPSSPLQVGLERRKGGEAPIQVL